MKTFILKLSNSHGEKFLLSADTNDSEDFAVLAQKIEEQLVVYGTYGRVQSRCIEPGKDPKILDQLKEITGYSFEGSKVNDPNLYLNFGCETFYLPGCLR